MDCTHPKAGERPRAQRARAALAAGALTLAGMAAFAATPANTSITNTASATYSVAGTPITVTGSVTVATSAHTTPATIEFMAHAASGAATSQHVPVTSCKAGAGFIPLPAPTPPGRSSLAVPGGQALTAANVYASGDVVFVKVRDDDQNVDPLVAETLDITVSSSNGDVESLRLTESGPSTGVFIGYLQTAAGAAQPGNCALNIGSNQKLTATYLDQSEKNIAITAAALVDPLGMVFDSATGQPIDGVEVTLINVATGLPATVVGNDGVSHYPSTVTTGSTVEDGGGTRYVLAAGHFQFPRVAPGLYRLSVATPVGYAFPSTVATAALQALSTSPLFIVTGSRGEAFQVVDGSPPLEIDVPLDPGEAASVNITKSAGKAVAAVGEFVPYTLTLRNGGKSAVANVRIADRLPPGFRYQAGSARLNGVALADPRVSADGRGLEFSVGSLPGSDSGSLTLRYVAAVGAGTPAGNAENTAQAVGGLKSNVARASVLIRDDLNRDRSILLGRVTLVKSCQDDENDAQAPLPVGLKDVRILLQDGTNIVTDAEGRWHADNLRPGTHVVQVDEASLPPDHEYRSCERDIRTGGRNFSQLVNLRGGTLWRTDFRFVKAASCLSQQVLRQGRTVSLALAAPVANERLDATVMLPGARVVAGSVQLDGRPFPEAEVGDGFLVIRLGRHVARWQHRLSFELDAEPQADLTVAVRLQPNQQPVQSLRPLTLQTAASEAGQCAPIALPDPQAAPKEARPEPAAGSDDVAGTRLQLIEQLPYDDKWIAAAEPGPEWLHPQASFMPALPVVKVAVKHAPQESVEVKVNGAPAGALHYDGMVTNPAGTLALSSWRSVPLVSGANTMEVIVRDPQGRVVLQESREIHYAVGPAKAQLETGRSTLVADGRFPPVIAVRMLDKDGKPVRRGASGEVQIGAPYLALNQAQALQNDPLTGNLGGKPRYEVGDDGVALIRLQPTTQAGEVVLHFDFGNNRKQDLRVWLSPDLRDWVLVGFAEGTLGHKRLSGNMESLGAAGADDRLFDRDRLAFYAKGQVKGEYLLTLAYDSAKEKASPGSQLLKQAINPNQYYTLYADATQPQFDAASASKLYLKIEKSQFYAMFGDYDTGLTLSELGRYSRTLNGVKTEYKGERAGFNAFASMTSQSFHKDEIPGQGVSGLYRLSSGGIVINSDKVRLETRDRLRPEIILKTQELTRYLDYQIDHAAGTLFFREPVPALDATMNPVFIVADYESDSQAGARLSYGGRAALRVGEQGTVGLTRIHEGNVGREAMLTALDASVPLDTSTRLRAEVAQSQRSAVEGSSSGGAYLVELAHNDKTVAARAYARKQDLGFGLGQQSSSATGTRKTGVDGQVKLSESMQLQGTAYREEKAALDMRADRSVAEARLQWSRQEFSTYLGGRAIKEADSTGLDNDVRQVIGGASYQLLDKRLTLRAGAEIDAAGHESVNFPNRVTLGADYRLTPETTLLAAREMAWTDPLKVSVTRFGLRTQPWMGSELAATLGNEAGEDSGRLYSNIGLVQKLQLNEQWAADIGLSRVQTLRGVAPTSLSLLPGASAGIGSGGTGSAGSVVKDIGDYTAAFVGAAYKDRDWSANGRIERRVSDVSNKLNLLLGARRNLGEGRAMSAGLIYNRVESETDTSQANLRLGYAYRPLEGPWIWLDRLDYVHESQQTSASSLRTRKLINNFNANWQPHRRAQLALQYSAKYVLETIDQAAYQGFTDLMGLEARHDLTSRWDVGVHASVLHAWKSGTRDYHTGVSTSVLLVDNVWLALGYNLRGFSDADFAGAQYRARGFYLSLRLKFDQDTFDLNDRRRAPFSFRP